MRSCPQLKNSRSCVPCAMIGTAAKMRLKRRILILFYVYRICGWIGGLEGLGGFKNIVACIPRLYSTFFTAHYSSPWQRLFNYPFVPSTQHLRIYSTAQYTATPSVPYNDLHL